MSDFAGIAIPSTSIEFIQIGLSIDHFYANTGDDNQVVMSGISTKRDIILAETSYYGEIETITPEQSAGDEPIVISGRALSRDLETPEPFVELVLYISLRGFERRYDILTDDNGEFSVEFEPAANESGPWAIPN